MSEQMSLFDFIEDGDKYKPIVSKDYYWHFKDYPKEKNGLKVFSCFACGGVVRWDTSWLVAKYWDVVRLINR